MIDIVNTLEEKALIIKNQLLTLASKESIHIGGDLSSLDVMTALWQYKMKYFPDDPKNEARDRFILSKGHASALLNLQQAMLGCFPVEKVYEEYAHDESMFAMHACNLLNPFVEVSTGSLGHGLAIGCGIASALKLKGNTESKVYVLMGDGEQSEGSVWEAVMNAAHLKLNNLIAIVDFNGLSSDGTIQEMTSLGNLSEKYRAFGWNPVVVNGHNMTQIVYALDHIDTESEYPNVLIAKTVKGHGVSFMENNVRWHAGKLNPEQYEEATGGTK